MKERLPAPLFKSDARTMPQAAALLARLAADPDQLLVLLELQRLLLRRIRSRERFALRARMLSRALQKKLRNDRPSKDVANDLRLRQSACESNLEQARYSIFLWKCFGDGAACVYQSPYNLKHLLYDQNYQVKQEAGFITGKEGLLREWAILEHGIQAGVPVVLSDLTNMIRYGDVCALAAADPVPIEVKSSANSGSRVVRQAQLLDELMSFYENDGAKEFRGIPNVTRQAIASGPSYADLMNQCIAQALQNGSAMANPEPGLHYLVGATEDGLDRFMSQLVSPMKVYRLLTPTPNWLPCLPFTLTLKPENLMAFLTGAVTVLVVIDMPHLKGLFRKYGSHATMMMDGTWAIQLCVNPDNLLEGVFRVSELHFARVGLEFQSLEWFAKENAIDLSEPVTSMTKEEFEAQPLNTVWTTVPEDWKAVRDFYDSGQLGHEP
ncbi:hypothetical protein [Pseudoduganella sp. R-34]|uniref:hypothetical protein n=1 Tax=Pseudoduganella sp. R-34 TaxID=3404062 RepID=UPI003CF9DEA9